METIITPLQEELIQAAVTMAAKKEIDHLLYVGDLPLPEDLVKTRSIAVDGWEGRPLGTLMVVGDTAAVMERSKQLTLNPFQGYSEAEKNILNPEVRNAIKNFAVLDGAFVSLALARRRRRVR